MVIIWKVAVFATALVIAIKFISLVIEDLTKKEAFDMLLTATLLALSAFAFGWFF